MQGLIRINNKHVEKASFVKKLFSGHPHECSLVIVIDDQNLNIKEFSEYLQLIYRFDGMLSSEGISKYSHLPTNQIKITEVKFGSVEIVIKALEILHAERIIIIGLALKYLPKVINSFLDIGIKYLEFQSKRYDYIDQKNLRKLKKAIREAINLDDELKLLDKKGKEKLVNVLEALYNSNSKRLTAASRFAKKSVRSVKFISKNKKS